MNKETEKIVITALNDYIKKDAKNIENKKVNFSKEHKRKMKEIFKSIKEDAK